MTDPGPAASRPRPSARERCLLLALMAEARPLSTAELRGRGLAPTPAERGRLAAAGLLDTTSRGRTLLHELTDDGWAWCSRELSDPSGPAAPRPGPAAGALDALLGGLRRFLDRSGLPLSEVFRPDAEAAVRAAYAAAVPPGNWIGLTELRRRVAGVPREEVDAALLRVFGTEGVHLVPEDDQKSLTPADRAAALRVGAKDVHLLAIVPASGGAADAAPPSPGAAR
ncbi:MAG: hypothetical protein ACFCVG_13840 [Kineosporiaceae bacterium]